MQDLSLGVGRGSAMMFYSTIRGSYTVRIRVQLDEEIHEGMMRRALDITARRYPYFCVSLTKNEKEYYYQPNQAPVALLHGSSPVLLNSEQTNRHIWSISVDGDCLYVDFFHGRADGAGLYPLVATLLYYYFHERYGLEDATGVRTLETPISQEEVRDPVDGLPLVDLEKIKGSSERAMNLAQELGLTPVEGKGFAYHLSFPEESFLPFMREHDATPGVLVNVLLTRAIERLAKTHEDPVIGGYVVNARPMLHKLETFHNCTSMVRLKFEDRIRAMPLEKQCTVYRGKTFLQSDEEYVQKQMMVTATLADRISKLPDIPSKMAACVKIMGNTFEGTTYMVSYVGKWKQKQLESHIRDFWLETPVGNYPVLEISAVNGRITLALMQKFQEEDLYRAFLEELDALHLPYREDGRKPITVAEIVR